LVFARRETPQPSSEPTVTDVKVVDASALAAILFAEPEAEAIAERLTGARLAAPSLLDYELANVCLDQAAAEPARGAARGVPSRVSAEIRNCGRGSHGHAGPG
jgi:uncharacterized protein with PIN domain